MKVSRTLSAHCSRAIKYIQVKIEAANEDNNNTDRIHSILTDIQDNVGIRYIFTNFSKIYQSNMVG